jgi:hypothetical protein
MLTYFTTVEERTRMRVHIFLTWEASVLELGECGVTMKDSPNLSFGPLMIYTFFYSEQVLAGFLQHLYTALVFRMALSIV